MMGGMRGNDPTGVACALNPELGFEGEGLLARPPGKKKHVLIVGAGPAGMEAARVAGLRGHTVSLYEKTRMLGGMLNVACLPPHKEELKTIVPYYESQLKKIGVKIYMEHEITGATIKANSPDAVVLAMGSFSFIPDLPGIEKKHVVTAIQVLSGLNFSGQHVVVVGGGLVGMETGEFLSDQGKTVTVVEMLDAVMSDVGPTSRWGTLSRMKKKMKILTSTKVTEIEEFAVAVVDQEGNKNRLKADIVVLATGMKENEILQDEEYQKAEVNYHKIGSCKEPGLIVQAISDGFKVGCAI
jgi:NADPH-dependent 2,4-dienoyl-CoA reductase/sulfur reductase-like enzyme